MSNKPQYLIIHCTDSKFGCASLIDEWHALRGFKRRVRNKNFDHIGYHFIINNGYTRNSKNYYLERDGLLEYGRSQNEAGAHCFGFNSKSLGICLVGEDKFSPAQINRLFCLCYSLMSLHNISPENIFGHYELDDRKTCPNIEMDRFRDYLQEHINHIKGFVS